jgi:septal ring factor EnvC (AmiA/AmiB activator)
MQPGRLSLLLIALCGAAPAGTARNAEHAQPAASSAAIQRRAAEQARAAEAEEGRLAQQRIAAAARMRGAETKTADAATEIAGLAARRRDAEQRLAERADALAPLLPLIERLALYPAETILAVPGSPQDTLRGLAVLHGLAQRLEQDAAALRAEQAAVQALEQEIAAAVPGLRAAAAAQAAQAAELDRQIEAARAGRRQAEDVAADAARHAAVEAARADTLRAAIAAMEAEHARAEAQAREDLARAERQRQATAAADAQRRQSALARPAGPGLDQRGPLMTPVVGQVVRGWGDATDAGPAQGVSYHSAPLARVVAPCSGRVAFSGPFRSFGVLLILDCGGGLHFVLAGLERLDVGVGAMVQRGEPVGVMPGWDPQTAARPGAVRPTLYIELRRDGSPVNPAPFLRARG